LGEDIKGREIRKGRKRQENLGEQEVQKIKVE